MASKIVFFDIAGEDDQALRDFYAEIFGWSFSDNGECTVQLRGPTIRGAVRKDPKEKRLYLGVDDVAETLTRIEATGGSVDQPRFEVPGLVVLGLFKDPAGNEMGLVEMDGDEVVVP